MHYESLTRFFSAATESFEMLEAFFIGRAFAETVNERLGQLAGDTLAQIGRLQTEIPQSIRYTIVPDTRLVVHKTLSIVADVISTSFDLCSDFQEEVLARARREMNAAAGINDDSSLASTSKSGTSRTRSLTPTAPDLGEAVDNLRAEVASARALIRQIQQQKNGNLN